MLSRTRSVARPLARSTPKTSQACAVCLGRRRFVSTSSTDRANIVDLPFGRNGLPHGLLTPRSGARENACQTSHNDPCPDMLGFKLDIPRHLQDGKSPQPIYLDMQACWSRLEREVPADALLLGDNSSRPSCAGRDAAILHRPVWKPSQPDTRIRLGG